MLGRSRILRRGMPAVGLAVAPGLSALNGAKALSPVVAAASPGVGLVVPMAVVFAAVCHADVIVHRTGEPDGHPGRPPWTAPWR